ncbi:MAG: aminopeptidase [bacterium]
MKSYDDEIMIAINNVYDNCVGIRKNEKVLIISDDGTIKIAMNFWQVALDKADEAYFIVTRQRHLSGEEPPDMVSNLMLSSDICLLITSKSMSHTNASRNATKNGARIASMPGITEDIIRRTLNADYNKIKEKTDEVAKQLSGAKLVRITNNDGTTLIFSIEGRKFGADTGIIREPGRFTNLPSGEVCTAPVEGTANGVIIVDGVAPKPAILDKPMTLEFENGYLVRLEGGRSADDINKILEMYGKNERNLAEIGIGTNEKATIIPNILEAEKAKGTFHIAIGDNKGMGGNVEANIHFDFVIKGARLEIDDIVIVDSGELLI